VCKTERGLKQHTHAVIACRQAEQAALDLRPKRQEESGPEDTNRRAKRRRLSVHQHVGDPCARSLGNRDCLVPETEDDVTGLMCLGEETDNVGGGEVVSDADSKDHGGFMCLDEETDSMGLGEDDSDADPENEDSDRDNKDAEMDAEDSESGVEASDSDSSGAKPEPNRTKLEEFCGYCTTFPEKHVRDLAKEKVTSIKLMDVLKRKRAPLNTFPEVLVWNLRDKGHLLPHETLKDTSKYSHRGPLMKMLKGRHYLGQMFPRVKKVTLPSSKAKVDIPYQNVEDCIVSLLTDPHLRDEDFLFHGDNPWAPPPESVPVLADLNTGEAYLKTHEKMTKHEGQMLVLTPMYIDGASTGQFSQLPVTPLKISLGIFKRETREKEWAWREIGWLPQVRKTSSRGKFLFKESGHLESQDVVMLYGEGEDEEVDSEVDEQEIEDDDGYSSDEGKETEVKAQDFHTMMHTILHASGFLKLQKTNMIWDLVYKGKCYMDSELVFAVPFVKADTEEADLHCGKYLVRTKNVKHG